MRIWRKNGPFWKNISDYKLLSISDPDPYLDKGLILLNTHIWNLPRTILEYNFSLTLCINTSTIQLYFFEIGRIRTSLALRLEPDPFFTRIQIRVNSASLHQRIGWRSQGEETERGVTRFPNLIKYNNQLCTEDFSQEGNLGSDLSVILSPYPGEGCIKEKSLYTSNAQRGVGYNKEP